MHQSSGTFHPGRTNSPNFSNFALVPPGGSGKVRFHDPGFRRKAPPLARITSIDALRGFVMFTMIFVNDLAGAPEKIVPDWMVHFSDRHSQGSGMTFVDLVFPAFLFIVGMSIPFALGSRLANGEPAWKMFGHIVTRTIALLALGILMVNGEWRRDARFGGRP